MSDDYQYNPISTGPDWRGRLKKMFAPIVAVAVTVAKFTFVIVKFGSIFIAIGGYALLSGWTFAIGFVLMIFAHEMGHYIEAKREGLNPRLPIFIPFALAYVRYTRGHPWQTVRVAIAGPIFGGVASVVLLGIARADHSATLHYVAYWGFLLNILNLVPISFFDGGQVLRNAHWLRVGGGRDKAVMAYWLYGATAVALALGMWASYIPQHRL